MDTSLKKERGRNCFSDFCSIIQALRKNSTAFEFFHFPPFKGNKLWAFSLKPLPHKESGSRADAEHASDTCPRILSDPSLHRYCSLDCKVKAFSRKAKSSDPPFLAVRKRAAENDDKNEAAACHLTVKGEAEEVKRNKRKGTPHRAPLF